MTLKEAAATALLIQDASNLSGVIHAWSRILRVVWEDVRAPRPDGTDPYGGNINEHPICVLFASKVASLTRCESANHFGQAYDAVMQLAAKAA